MRMNVTIFMYTTLLRMGHILWGCRTVLMCDTDGNRLRRYHLQRVNDMVLSADGRTLITVACERKIKLLRLHESREVSRLRSGVPFAVCLPLPACYTAYKEVVI